MSTQEPNKLFYTATLTRLGFQVLFTKEQVDEYCSQLGVKESQHYYDAYLKPLDFTQIYEEIAKRPGIWLFITVTGETELSFQKFLEDKDNASRVMYRSVPTKNFRYDQPYRLLTLYVMDFRK